MKSQRISIILTLLLMFNPGSKIYAQETANILHILYTQNNNGKIDNCHCPRNPLGGFEKRSTFFTQWLSEHPNTLIFDSGDFLSFDGNGDTDLKVIELMEDLHYTAVNLGDQEFSNGAFFLEDYLLSAKLPLISSNLMIDSEKRPRYKRYQAIELAGVQIVIMGVLGPDNIEYFAKADESNQVWGIDPHKALQVLNKHEPLVAEADIHILLSNLGLDRDIELAEAVPFIDLIIGGHSQHKLEEAVNQNGTLIVQCGKDGHYVGHLEIIFQNGKISGHKHELISMGVDIPSDEYILKKIQEM